MHRRAPRSIPALLVDGPHSLVARAEDVAGNVRTAEAAILVDNDPPRAGTVALVGEATVSEALTAEPTGFAGQDVAYAYRWQRCDAAGEECAEIGGAVASTYALRPGDAGHRVRALVTASDGGGSVRVASMPSTIVAVPGTGPSGGFSAAAPSAPVGHLTAWLERGRRHLHATTVRWPTRVRIRGRLTDRAGRPLPHTVVRMLERVDGRRRRALTGVRTRRDGRFTTFTEIGPSRHLRLVYGRAAVSAAAARPGDRPRHGPPRRRADPRLGAAARRPRATRGRAGRSAGPARSTLVDPRDPAHGRSRPILRHRPGTNRRPAAHRDPGPARLPVRPRSGAPVRHRAATT